MIGPAMTTSLVRRTSCRVCGSTRLAEILDLGDQYIAGAFADPGGDNPLRRRIPLQLVRCDMQEDQSACGLVQLRHTVPGSILYKSYWYRSGVNQTMTDNLHEIADQAERLVGLEAGDLVIDIGCNDGTLLDGYQTTSLKVLGFDPSSVARYALEKGYEVVEDFFARHEVDGRYPGQKARIVTSIAMFYDLEVPSEFVSDVKHVLSDDGVWVLELHYLPTMLEQNGFDAICHEHLEYYSLAVLEKLFAGAGLRVTRAELNDINGGSIRLFVQHDHHAKVGTVDQEGLQLLRIDEFERELDSAQPYERFASASESIRDELRHVCLDLAAQGKTIHVYGASTKGNTILQYANLDNTVIPAAADRNPDKWGSRTIGTEIPIISEEESRAMKPDFYLALPWHFLPEFVSREQEFVERGGRFIVPFPEVTIV